MGQSPEVPGSGRPDRVVARVVIALGAAVLILLAGGLWFRSFG